MKFKKFAFSLFIAFLLLAKQGKTQSFSVDSAKTVLDRYTNNEKEYIKTCFFVADSYMDVEQYDSAQIWLNKIHEKVPSKKATLFNYFLTSRQAEVYYYNNLQQLGLQESFRGLQIAQALHDSVLLTDSYNFLGIFYMNLDSSEIAIPYYKKGLNYIGKQYYSDQYIDLSKPFHLYGNLAEAFYKLSAYDSALYYNHISLIKANEIKSGRGIAVSYSSTGDVFLALDKIDSALYNYQSGKKAARLSKDVDVELYCYGGIAQCFHKLDDSKSVVMQLDSAFTLLNSYPTLNRFFALQFLNVAVTIYKDLKMPERLAQALEIKSAIETANINSNNDQIQTILNASVMNESRFLSLEVLEAKQKQKLANTRLILSLIAIGFLAIGFLVYRYYQNQKLALSKMRQKISQDLHDDIGASLSSLQIYGSVAERTLQNNPEKAAEMLTKISTQSKTIMEDMNDIVWSMKTEESKSNNISTRIKNYGVELLSNNDINFVCRIDVSAETALQNITARRNILMIAKEAMNNIAKYSKSTTASLTLKMDKQQLVLQIIDDGVGFDFESVVKGNGLENMKLRVAELKGYYEIQTSVGKGTKINVWVPENRI